jgi:hypothetical protein
VSDVVPGLQPLPIICAGRTRPVVHLGNAHGQRHAAQVRLPSASTTCCDRSKVTLSHFHTKQQPSRRAVTQLVTQRRRAPAGQTGITADSATGRALTQNRYSQRRNVKCRWRCPPGGRWNMSARLQRTPSSCVSPPRSFDLLCPVGGLGRGWTGPASCPLHTGVGVGVKSVGRPISQTLLSTAPSRHGRLQRQLVLPLTKAR